MIEFSIIEWRIRWLINKMKEPAKVKEIFKGIKIKQTKN